MSPRRRLLLAVLLVCALAVATLVLGARWAWDSARVEPDRGGSFVEAVAGRPQYINPLLSQFNDVDRDIVSLVFAGLTKVGNNGRPEPDLAERWEVSDEGKVYTFRLRADRKWHNGEPVTVDDVAFTIRLLQDPKFPGLPDMAASWKGIAVQKVDERTIRFTLPAPYGPFLEQASLGILPAHQFGNTPAATLLEHAFNGFPVGAGPYKVTQASLQQVTLVPDPAYPGPKPYHDSLVFKFYPSARAALTAVLQGEASGARAVPADELARLRQDKRVSLLTAPLVGRAAVLFLNARQAPFDETNVRRAVAMAVDRAALVEGALTGQGQAAYGPVSPLSWAYRPSSPPQPDLELARAQLEASGWKDIDGDGVRERSGKPLVVTLATSTAPERQAVARTLTAQLAKIGFKVVVAAESWEEFREERVARRDFTAALADVWLPNYDPDCYAFWHSSQALSGLNLSGWSSAKADELLDQGRRAGTDGARTEIYAEFQSLFAAESPAVFLYYPSYSYVLAAEVKGASLDALLDPSERFRTFPAWYSRTKKVLFAP